MARKIERPAIYAFMAALTAASGMAGLLGLAWLARQATAAPALIVAQKAELEPALQDAPWFAFAGEGGEGDVWLLASPACPACRALEDRLQSLDAELRVIVTAPREAAALEISVAAELARRRDADAFRRWRAQPNAPLAPALGVASADLGGAAAAGYAEWGHASFDRLAQIARANGQELTHPALFWRRGREWRLAVQPDGVDLAALRRDLDAGV